MNAMLAQPQVAKRAESGRAGGPLSLNSPLAYDLPSRACTQLKPKSQAPQPWGRAAHSCLELQVEAKGHLWVWQPRGLELLGPRVTSEHGPCWVPGLVLA